MTDAVELSRSNGGMVFPLDLEPYGSRLLVFSDRERMSKTTPLAVPRLPKPFDLSEGWNVTFEEAGKNFQLDRLRSWTELKDLQFFSGQATYSKSVVIPPEFLAEGIQVDLNFGEPASVHQERSSFPGLGG